MGEEKDTEKEQPVINIAMLAQQAQDYRFRGLLVAALPERKTLRRLGDISVWLHPIDYARFRPCRYASCTHETGVVKDREMGEMCWLLLLLSTLVFSFSFGYGIDRALSGHWSDIEWKWILSSMILFWFSFVGIVYNRSVLSWTAHKSDLQAKRAEILKDCLKDHLSQQVQKQRARLLGATGIFEQLKKLLAIQIIAYGRDLIEIKEVPKPFPPPIVLDAPFRTADQSSQAVETPHLYGATLPEDLVSCSERLSIYFDKREQDLLGLCEGALPMIAQLQEAGKTENVAAKGAEHLEDQFARKIQEKLDEIERITNNVLKLLTGAFQGESRGALEQDLKFCTQQAATINTDLSATGVLTVEDARRVSVAGEDRIEETVDEQGGVVRSSYRTPR